MLKNNKKTLIITSVITLLPMIAGLLLWKLLPDSFAVHWNAAGQVDRYGRKSEAVILLPLLMLALHWLCFGATCLDPKAREIDGKAMRMVLWICPMLSVLTGAFLFGNAFGVPLAVEKVVPILLGILFIMLGNYLPKCKQNYSIGIKIPWALENEENWNKTHRLAGKLWVLGGFAFLIAAPFNKIVTIYTTEDPLSSQLKQVSYMNLQWVFIGIFAVTLLVPIVYSYLYYRNHEKRNKNGN